MQKASSFKNKRKAISPILATIILIIITVVVGVALYGFVTGYFSSMSTSSSATVETNLVIPSGSSAATWTVNIRNTGTTAMNNVTVILYSSQGAKIVKYSSDRLSVSPGQEYTITLTGLNYNLTSANIVSGSSYSYAIQLSFANGASKTITGSVTATAF
jgi:flagellin-like protein